MDLYDTYSSFHVGTFYVSLWLIASYLSYILSFQAYITVQKRLFMDQNKLNQIHQL